MNMNVTHDLSTSIMNNGTPGHPIKRDIRLNAAPNKTKTNNGNYDFVENLSSKMIYFVFFFSPFDFA